MLFMLLKEKVMQASLPQMFWIRHSSLSCVNVSSSGETENSYTASGLQINVTEYFVLSATPPPRPLPHHHLSCPKLVSPASCPNKCYVARAYVMKHGKCLVRPLCYPDSCHHQLKHLRAQMNLPSVPPGQKVAVHLTINVMDHGERSRWTNG